MSNAVDKPTGGTAFPTRFGASGMSLRDWFAGMALQSIIRVKDMNFHPEHDAKWAYQIADAMLAEREK